MPAETPTLLRGRAKRERWLAAGDSLWGGMWRRFRRHPGALVGTAILGLIALSAIFAFLSPYDPNATAPTQRFLPMSRTHLLGTDRIGRDVFTRILYGGRISLSVGLLSAITSLLFGCAIGIPAGYFGGQVDNVLMRFADFVMSFPSLYLLIMLFFVLSRTNISIFQGGIGSIVLVIGLTSWTAVARLVRATFLSLREELYVTAVRATGASNLRIMLLHILPNALGPLIVSTTMGVAWAILTESGLSFLGFGIQPPTPSWGNILTDAQTTISLYPWLSIFPGLMIFFSVIAVNFIGDALHDAFDPRHQIRREIG